MRGPTVSYILFELVGVSTIRHRAVSNHHFPLQFATMDKIHREMLGKMTSKIMGRISSPRVFSGHLREIFSAADVEEIAAREAQMGPTHGTQTMLSLLEKRGPKAYGLFLKVLQDPNNFVEDLADELENEEWKLRGKTEPPMRRARSLPPSAEPVEPCGEEEVHSPPPPYSAPAVQTYSPGNGPGSFNYSHGQGPRNICKQPSIPEVSSQDNPEVVLTEGTLIRDIPYRLRNKIEMLLDPPDANHHDWRGMASVMNLNTEEVRQLENARENGKMKGLVERMIQRHKTVNDLLGWLKHPDVHRLDVIDEIKKEHHNIPNTLLLIKDDESSEDQESAATEVVSSVEETSSPETKSKLLGIPQQEWSQDPQKIDRKPDAHAPSQVESDDDPKAIGGQTKLHAEQDLSLTSPMDNLDIDSKPDYRKPSQEEGSNSIASNDDDDVFDSTDNVKKHFHALLISCSTGNDKEDKKHDTELRHLEGELEDSWDVVKRQAKCKVSNLIQTVHSFLMNPGESGKIVSFVYLAGPTVQINGENYLLPSDLKSPSSRADLMHSSLNINWLVKQLSENYMQVVIVDGAHENSVKDLNLNGVLQGLAPIQPPPNGIIAFPCPPGTIRPEQERLAYVKSVVKNLKEESNLMLADLFEKVRADLASQSVSSPVEFSLTPSPLPICVNPEDMQAGLCVDSSEDVTYHVIIVANANYDGHAVDSKQCMKDREQLRMALLKTGWECELEACDKPAKDIMEGLRKVLNKLAGDQKRVVMVYFMGYTKMIMDVNYFFGSDFTAFAEPLRSSVPLQWALDLMCEKLMGKKILIVDDLNTSSREGLAEMSAPLDVMISLPSGTRSDPNASGMQREASFTSNFARLLEAKAGQLPLKEMVKRAARASFDQHRLSSNLFDPK